MTTNRIVKILMERDGISYDEAMDLYKKASKEIEIIFIKEDNVVKALIDMEEVIMDYFKLEPDYLEDILGY